MLQIERPDPMFAAPFRYRMVDGHYLLTNQAGQYVFLSESEFRELVEGTIAPESPLYRTLADKSLIRKEMQAEDLAERIATRKSFLDYGPNLHVLEVTLRCNQTCVYCHSSRAPMSETGKDMSKETAEKAVDLILQSSSPTVTIEFQGGEPLVNWPVLQHIVEYSLKKNENVGKTIEFSLVTNLSLMDEDKLKFLLAHKVQICTSVDGPAELHNAQRKWENDAYAATEKWIGRINRAYADAGLDPEVYHVEGLLTTTRQTLEQPREVVDTYMGLGFRALFLRPVDPFGFVQKTGDTVRFGAEEYLEFYRRAVDYMIELNLQGQQILERYAAIFLTKILAGEDPNFLDLRSPCGAGIGQMAYGHDGELYVCDEARMMARMGDDFFRIGNVQETSYHEAVGHETVRALTVSSNVDGNPDCSSCVYNPYCGVCPVYNYATQGSIHGQLRTSAWCTTLMGIQDYLFGKLLEGDAKVLEVFDRWIQVRPRDHYLHGI